MVCDNQVRHRLVEVQSLIPTVAPGDMPDVLIRLLVAIVAPIDMNTGAIEMCNAGRQAQALRRGRRHEAAQFGHPSGIEGLQGPTQGVIVELRGSHAGRNELRGRLVRKEARREVEHLVDQPQASEHHCLDGFTLGAASRVRVLVRGVVEDVAYAELVEHASHKAEVVQHVAAVRGMVGHHHLF